MLLKKRNQLRETLSHYLTGIIVLIKGYEKSEHFHEHPYIVIAFFLLGAFIIVATYFHHFFEKQVKEFRSLLHVTEFVVLCLVSYYYWQEGKKALPLAYLLAAIGNLIAAIVFYRKKVKAVKSADVTV